jgi:pyruvate/2-oxoglutarate dehydrogenase complex dihydrolipoamide acyltransferase (E2) component
MRHEFRLPDIGEGLKSAEVVEWLVAVGEIVNDDQPIVVVQTDKADVELPIPVGGTITRLAGGVGTVIDVGSMVAEVEAGDRNEQIIPEPERPAPAVTEPHVQNPSNSPVTAPRAAPAVRRRATELGVDLASITGTGPGGRVVGQDVERAVASLSGAEGEPNGRAAATDQSTLITPAEGVAGRYPMRGRRRETSRRMKQAWQEIPHMADFRETDARGLIALRDLLRREAPPADAGSITYVPILAKIVAVALMAHRVVNATVDPHTEDVIVHEHVGLGIATQTNDGLVVPVVKNAEMRSIPEIAREVKALGAAADNRRLRPDALSGGTFTLNNIGALGATRAFPIIRYPEVALMAFGRITPRPVVDGEDIVARPMVDITTVADHRVLDGRELTAFVDTVCALIENPMRLLIELR